MDKLQTLIVVFLLIIGSYMYCQSGKVKESYLPCTKPNLVNLDPNLGYYNNIMNIRPNLGSNIHTWKRTGDHYLVKPQIDPYPHEKWIKCSQDCGHSCHY
jgi:hypothetical protein